MAERPEQATNDGNPARTRRPDRPIIEVLSARDTLNDYDTKAFTEYRPADSLTECRSTPDLIRLLERDKNVQVDALVMGVTKERKFTHKRMNRESFLKSWKSSPDVRKFKETFDAFDNSQRFPGLVGQDFIPLLGGPYYKQLYYRDYLQMHGQAFFAYHHDPLGNAVVNITRDFTLGRGFRVDCESPQHLAIWRAFEKVNDLQNLFDQIATDLSWCGEVMPWWLPNNQTKIAYRVRPGQEPQEGYLPRVRLIDPSAIWEIVTYPEDITRVLYYQWVSPTQYQIYTGTDKGEGVPSLKFIVQQVPANEVLHYKVNATSGEKRGRSDLFPALGYMKRVRDLVNYSIIAAQKNAAYAIDTTVSGDDADIAAYMAQQQALGTIHPAGSEFIHSKAVERKYMASEGSRTGAGESFQEAVSMVAAATQIPMNYFGMHFSGGQSRATALVATEPVAKKFEKRQLVYERIIKDMAERLFKQLGMDNEDIEVTFPEVILQDRSAKMKDLQLAVQMKWISNERAATIAAKELGVTEYEYDEEAHKIEEETQTPELEPSLTSPLTAPGSTDDGGVDKTSKPSAVTSANRRDLAMGMGA